ncbi:MAG: SGNH/GDSL hydrolase family protein [Bacilli bacterium]|nr:SGNH/GDSL hydrolase family protein [Bacilli bacterium]
MNKELKYLYLADSYDLVVGHPFELFYRGIIRLFDPYKYYIHVECPKGMPFRRYYTFTPTIQDLGSYSLTLTLYDDDHNIVEQASTILNVWDSKVTLDKKLNVLCFGDSLTYNGVWVSEGFRLLNENNNYELTDKFNYIGNCKITVDEKELGYEGYGGWTWKSYVTNEVATPKSNIWVEAKNHKITDEYQHSIWLNNNLEWILETIEENRLKFKRGEKNTNILPTVLSTFSLKNDPAIIIESTGYSFESKNPFWDNNQEKIDFKKYAKEFGCDDVDLVYILLTWNGLYKPFNDEFSHHLDYAKIIIEELQQSFPNAHISLLGIPLCSVTGGIAYSYGASGPYSDTFGEVTTAFNYNRALEDFVKNYQNVSYTDVKSMFDTEYNMPYVEKNVNARSNIKEMIGVNGVHPSMDGYLQIGDVYYRTLIKDLHNLKK